MGPVKIVSNVTVIASRYTVGYDDFQEFVALPKEAASCVQYFPWYDGYHPLEEEYLFLNPGPNRVDLTVSYGSISLLSIDTFSVDAGLVVRRNYRDGIAPDIGSITSGQVKITSAQGTAGRFFVTRRTKMNLSAWGGSKGFCESPAIPDEGSITNGWTYASTQQFFAYYYNDAVYVNQSARDIVCVFNPSSTIATGEVIVGSSASPTARYQFNLQPYGADLATFGYLSTGPIEVRTYAPYGNSVPVIAVDRKMINDGFKEILAATKESLCPENWLTLYDGASGTATLYPVPASAITVRGAGVIIDNTYPNAVPNKAYGQRKFGPVAVYSSLWPQTSFSVTSYVTYTNPFLGIDEVPAVGIPSGGSPTPVLNPAFKALNPVTVDGRWTSSNEWTDTTSILLSAYRGSGTAYWKIKHDTNYLYALVDFVSDGSTEAGDSCSLYVDGNHDLGSAPKKDDFALAIEWPNPNAYTSMIRWGNGTSWKAWNATLPTGFKAISSTNPQNSPYSDTAHVIYEFQIPKSSLNSTNIGFYVVAYNGNVKMTWQTSQENIPSTWGSMPLASEPIPEFPMPFLTLSAALIVAIMLLRKRKTPL